MKISIIYSNHHSGNFNEVLLNTLIENLSEQGHEIVVRDLYKMDFNPVLKTSDFESISSGNTPPDILREQDFVKWSDLMIFVYPLWWGGMPAIMKGYIDRVFSWGFAYKTNGNGPYPLLTDKKAIVMATMGQSRADYEKGMFQAMNLVNVEGVFGFCGVDVVDQIYFSSIHNVSERERNNYLIQAVESVKALDFINESTRE
jgi:NAD(P)H dehydrogenase (quinone)